jgi:hypothetical protein
MLNMEQLTDHLVIAYHDLSNNRIYIVEYKVEANTCTQISGVAVGGGGGNTGIAGFSVNDFVHLSELTINGVPYLGVIISTYNGTTSAGYYAATTGGSFASDSLVEITDADFPPKDTPAQKAVGPMVQLNNRVYVMSEGGYIHGSEADSITSWHTSGVTPAISYPDKGVGLCRYKHHLIAFGNNTMEFFNDEGLAAPSLPIQRMDQAFLKIGAYGQKSYINDSDTIWWVSKTDTFDLELYKLDGYTPKKITNNTQSLHLVGAGSYLGLQLTNQFGVKHLITNAYVNPTFPGNVSTIEPPHIPEANPYLKGILCYAIDSDAWWVWSTEFDTIDGILTCSQTNNGTYLTRHMMYVDALPDVAFNYSAHVITNTHYEDRYPLHSWESTRVGNSATKDLWRIPVFIRTNVYDFETEKRKTVHKLKLIMDRVRVSTGGSAAEVAFAAEDMNLYYMFSKVEDAADKAVDWSFREQTISSNTVLRYYINNLGMGRSWKFGIFCNSYLPMRIECLEVDVSQGTQ